MYLGGIWIKAIAQIVFAVLFILCGIYAHKKLKRKPYELSVVIILGLILIGFGTVNVTHAIKPDVKTINADYIYQSNNGVIFGRYYNFKDDTGEVYSLTMDPITYRKIFYGKEFKKEQKYTITYESKSETIIQIS